VCLLVLASYVPADRIVNALTVQLYCVMEASGRALKDGSGQAEKLLEVQMTVFKQQQVGCAVQRHAASSGGGVVVMRPVTL
jgi:hypothetical protein